MELSVSKQKEDYEAESKNKVMQSQTVVQTTNQSCITISVKRYKFPATENRRWMQIKHVT